MALLCVLGFHHYKFGIGLAPMCRRCGRLL